MYTEWTYSFDLITGGSGLTNTYSGKPDHKSMSSFSAATKVIILHRKLGFPPGEAS